MKEKKVSEMTFKEFLEKGRTKGLNVNDIETVITNSMKREGFTKEQINCMKMDKVFNLWLEAMSNENTILFSNIYQNLENNPNAFKNNPYAVSSLNKLRELTSSLEKEANRIEHELAKREKEKELKDKEQSKDKNENKQWFFFSTTNPKLHSV